MGTSKEIQRVRVIDSHTGGEPTRVVVSGAPRLGEGSMSARRECFRREFDHFRSAIVNEPRGSDVMVGAILCEPVDSANTAGVIFFNNVGYLGMCGHGMIGLIVTLHHMGRIKSGVHKIETPVGVVEATLDESGAVSVQNVPSYRFTQKTQVNVPGLGNLNSDIVGDIAWGGNWFFLVENSDQELTPDRVDVLTDYAWKIRQALLEQGITGEAGVEIDHIELFAPSKTPGIDGKNFVLCPGKSYDRSPCGTGTSAKLACLVSDGKLQPGQIWRQESIIGSVFEGRVQIVDGKIIPTITGTAFVTSESVLILNSADPFCWGFKN